METIAITSDDTLTLYDRVFVDFADGDTSAITFPNDMVTMKTGKNRNSIYARNATGENADMVLRLIRGSSDDNFMQGKINAAARDFVGQVLCTGQFVKRLGNGQGGVTRDVYTLGGGVITKPVEGKENVEGDTEQGVAVYNLKFATAPRSLQ